MNSTSKIALLSTLFAVLTACGGAENIEGDVAGECTDAADNDANGDFDCDDAGCAASPDCVDDTTTTPITGTTSTTGTTNTITATGDTGEYTGPLKEVATIAFSGFFGYDQSSGQIVDYSVDGAAAPSLFIMTLGTASYGGDPNDTSNYCSVWIDLAGKSNESFAQADGYLFGFYAAAGGAAANTGTSDCLAKGFDPAWFYNVDPFLSMADLAGGWGLGVAIGGPVSPDVDSYLSSLYTAQEIDEQFIGGELVDTAGLGGGTNIYFTAFPVDGTMNVDSSATPLSHGGIINGQGGLRSGVYSFSLTIFWLFS